MSHLLLEEVSQELFGDLGVLRLCGVLHGVLEQVVLFAQLHALLPPVVAFVEVRGYPPAVSEEQKRFDELLLKVTRGLVVPEFDEFMLLELLRQRDVVEVVERVDGCFETVVVLFGDEEAVQRLVHRFVVQVLN